MRTRQAVNKDARTQSREILLSKDGHTDISSSLFLSWKPGRPLRQQTHRGSVLMLLPRLDRGNITDPHCALGETCSRNPASMLPGSPSSSRRVRHGEAERFPTAVSSSADPGGELCWKRIFLPPGRAQKSPLGRSLPKRQIHEPDKKLLRV